MKETGHLTASISKHETLDLKVMGSNPTLGVGLTLKKEKKKTNERIHESRGFQEISLEQATQGSFFTHPDLALFPA